MNRRYDAENNEITGNLVTAQSPHSHRTGAANEEGKGVHIVHSHSTGTAQAQTQTQKTRRQTPTPT